MTICALDCGFAVLLCFVLPFIFRLVVFNFVFLVSYSFFIFIFVYLILYRLID